MSSIPTWSGGSIVNWGGEEAPRKNSWGDPSVIPVMDRPVLLSDYTAPKHHPRTVWKTQPSLRKVVSFAARNVAVVPLHIYVRESDTNRVRDTASEAAKLLSQPSPFVSLPRLLDHLVVDMMLYDKWMVLYDGTALRRVPAKLIEVKSDFLGGVTSLGVRGPNNEVLDVTDAVLAYDAGWSDDGEGGISPMKTLAVLLDEQLQAIQWRAEAWENAARLTGVLTTEKTLAKQNRDRLKASWAAFRSKSAGGVPLLEDGVKFQTIEPRKPVDSSDLQGRQLTDVEVASAYHIAPELVGARAGTFSNIKAFREMLYGPTLGPILTRIEAAFNERIIPQLAPEGAYCEFNRESAMAGSFAEQAAYLQKTVGGPYMTRAEARALQNLPHIDGTEELITPMNVTEGGLADPSDTDSTKTGLPEWGGTTNDKNQD